MGQPRPLFINFRSFQTQILQNNWRLEWDSTSDHWSRRGARWPLDHHHGPQNRILKGPLFSFIFVFSKQLTIHHVLKIADVWIQTRVSIKAFCICHHYSRKKIIFRSTRTFFNVGAWANARTIDSSKSGATKPSSRLPPEIWRMRITEMTWVKLKGGKHKWGTPGYLLLGMVTMYDWTCMLLAEVRVHEHWRLQLMPMGRGLRTR